VLVHLFNGLGTLLDGSGELGISLLSEVSHALGGVEMVRVTDAVGIEEGINGLNFRLLGVLHGLATIRHVNFECSESLAQVVDITVLVKDFVVFGLGHSVIVSNLVNLLLRFRGVLLQGLAERSELR